MTAETIFCFSVSTDLTQVQKGDFSPELAGHELVENGEEEKFSRCLPPCWVGSFMEVEEAATGERERELVNREHGFLYRWKCKIH